MDCRRIFSRTPALLQTNPHSLTARILVLAALLLSSAVSVAVNTGYNPADTRAVYEYVAGSALGPIAAAEMKRCTIPSKAQFAGCAAKIIQDASSKLSSCTPQLNGFSGLTLTSVNNEAGTFNYNYTALTYDPVTQGCKSVPMTNGTWTSYRINTVCPNAEPPFTRDGTSCRAPADNNRGCNPGQCCTSDSGGQGGGGAPWATRVGDPVDIRNGNVSRQETDLALAGGSLTFSRYYNSNESYYDSYSRPNVAYQLGNWRGDYLYSGAIRLTYAPAGAVNQTATAVVTRADGRGIVFKASYDSSASRFTSAWASSERLLQLVTVQGDTGAWTALDLQDGSGGSERYDTAGRLASVSDGDGVLRTITRSGNSVTRVTDRFGNYLDFTYAYRGYTYALVTLKLNGAVWATYGYNSTGYLASVTYADGSVRRYSYNDVNFPIGLSRVDNEKGEETASWFYDGSGRATRNREAAGVNDSTYAYYPDGSGLVSEEWEWFWVEPGVLELRRTRAVYDYDNTRTLTEQLPNGLVNAFYTRPAGGELRTTRKTRTLNGVTSEFRTSYDVHGNIASTSDWNGNRTDFAYNERNLEVRRSTGAGTPQQRDIYTEWHPTLRLPVKITTPTQETVYTYSGNKLATRTETDRTAWAAGSRTWTYSYTAAGLLQSVDGPLPGTADITNYAYDAAGRLTSVTDALGHVVQITAHNALGNPQTVVDANGITTRLGYNARGRLVSSTRVDPVLGDLVTTLTRDAVGNVTRITLPDGSATNYEYNPVGEVTAIQDATGARLEYERDAEGNVTRTHTRHANGALVRRLEQTWNGLKQVTAVSGLTTTHATYQYDDNGNAVRSADGLDHATQNVYDALDRVVRSADATGAATQFGYDDEGRLASVTDARNLTTTYDYDGLGCLRRLTSPDTGVTAFTCDMAGNVTSKTDARGVTATFGHDLLNRLTSTVYSNAPGELALFGYDATADGNKGVGRLTAAQNDGADIARRYDARGNLVEDRRTIGGASYVTAYAYDRADRLASITYPSGRVVNYVRNAAGQVSAVTTSATPTGSQTVAGNIVWAPFGGIASFTYGNGLAETRTYDTDGYLTHIGVGALISRDYGRDAAGRIIQIADADPLQGETYGYSNADRLTAASGPYGTRTWSYDGVGNRTAQDENGGISSYAYGGDSNRLYQVTGSDALSLDYDAAGNTLTKNDIAFTWNAANRMSSVTVPGANGPETTAFAYTALGERVLKTGPQDTTYFHYDIAGHLLAESDDTGAVIREYLWLGDKPVGLVAKRNAGTNYELFAVHTDHLDTALSLTDSTQQVVWHYNREPFGQLAAGNNTVRWPLRFPGQYEDGETGLFYNYFRDYDSGMGRYVESDPIGLRGGVNSYAYVGGNPIGSYDPLGLDIVVIYNGPVGSRGPGDLPNPIGHVAVAITNSGVYSFGTSHELGSSLSQYVLDMAAERNSTMYIIPTTPEQDAAALRNLQSYAGGLPAGWRGIFLDNCASRVSETMRSAGVGRGNSSPIAVANIAASEVRRHGGTVVQVPMGTTVVPASIRQFEPRD